MKVGAYGVIKNGLDGPETFGSFVRKHREALGMSMRELAQRLGLGAPYVNDIEKGNRPAPKGYLEAMTEILELSQEEKAHFYDLAAETRGYQYEDINPYLEREELARVALRRARDTGLPAKEWREFIQRIEALNMTK